MSSKKKSHLTEEQYSNVISNIKNELVKSGLKVDEKDIQSGTHLTISGVSNADGKETVLDSAYLDIYKTGTITPRGRQSSIVDKMTKKFRQNS